MRWYEIIAEEFINEIDKILKNPDYEDKLFFEEDLNLFLEGLGESWDQVHTKTLSTKIYTGELTKLDSEQFGFEVHVRFSRKSGQDHLEIETKILSGPLPQYTSFTGSRIIHKLFDSKQHAKDFVTTILLSIGINHTTTTIDPNNILI